MGQRYLRMEDQKPMPGLVRNQDFGIRGGLLPKVKMLICVKLGRSYKQTSETQTYSSRG